jgi:hypothetical protein
MIYNTTRCITFKVFERLNMLCIVSLFASAQESCLCACNQSMTLRLRPSKSSVTISVTISNAFSANPTACTPLHKHQPEKVNIRYIHTYMMSDSLTSVALTCKSYKADWKYPGKIPLYHLYNDIHTYIHTYTQYSCVYSLSIKHITHQSPRCQHDSTSRRTARHSKLLERPPWTYRTG